MLPTASAGAGPMTSEARTAAASATNTSTNHATRPIRILAPTPDTPTPVRF